jgi:hypothetical protein
VKSFNILFFHSIGILLYNVVCFVKNCVRWSPSLPKKFCARASKKQQQQTTILLIGCHVRVIIIFKNSHTHNFCPAYFGLVCYIVICVFCPLSISLSLLFGYITHTHTQTDRHTNPTRLSSKILFFFLVIFCCDLVLRHRVKKEFFWEKEKKVFRVVGVCDRLVVCRCKKKKKKIIIKRSNNFIVLDWRIFKWISIVCCIYIY